MGQSSKRRKQRIKRANEKATTLLASELATKRAIEWGINLLEVEPTGKKGQITVFDVINYRKNRKEISQDQSNTSA